MNWGNLLFSIEGRINRTKYWLAVLVYIAVSVIMVLISLAIVPHSFLLTYLLMIMYLIVGFGCFVSGVAVGVKRLHDRDKKDWWLLIFYIVPIVMFGTAMVTAMKGISEDTRTGSESIEALIYSLIAIAIMIWALVELGCLRGTFGANRYGPDPVAPKPAQH